MINVLAVFLNWIEIVTVLTWVATSKYVNLVFAEDTTARINSRHI